MASTYIYRDHTASNRRTWTWSAWVKLGSLSGNQSFFTSRTDNSNYSTIRIEPDRFHIFDLVSGGFNHQVKTNRRLRDPNCWYHLLVAVDTTQGTASNRIKMYVNGEQETSLAESSYPAQNYQTFVNQADTHYLGQGGNLGDKFDGSMSHIHFVDGTALTPSTFGSTDSTTGEFKINTSPSVTYGTNGFFILKDGNSTTDQSGESNNWTVSGTLTKTEDCPSNVFATINPLDNYYQSSTFSEGNNTVEHGSSPWTFNTSTLKIPENTKFYFEAKVITMNQCTIGIQKNVSSGTGDYLGQTTAVSFRGHQGDVIKNGSAAGGTFATYTANDIISVACDTVNNRIFFGKNGTWLNSGDPTSSTGAITIDDNTDYFFALGDNTSGARGKWSANFGNGYFGTTAVSSAGTNASGIGIFEYDVPSGYTALSTKGLNE